MESEKIEGKIETEEINRFNEAEILVGGFFLLGIDLICILIDITGVGMAVAPFLQAPGTFFSSMWLKSKGDSGNMKLGRQITKYASNALPVVPTLFLSFLIETYIHNHPERFKKIKDVKNKI
jgi:hypothetical protein